MCKFAENSMENGCRRLSTRVTLTYDTLEVERL